MIIALTVAQITLAAPNDEEFVVINAGRVIPIDGDEIRNGTVVIVDGKIRSVGKGIDYPKNATIIDAPGETVMPGWIHVRSRWGLRSYSRNGVHGDLTVADEFRPGDDPFTELREAGFTLVALYPDGNGAPGRAIILRTGGDEADRQVQSPSYLRITMTNQPGDKKTLRGALKKAKEEIEKVEKAKKEFEEKQKAAETQPQSAPAESAPATGDAQSKPATQPATQPEKFEPPKIDPAHQPFVDLIQKKEGVYAVIEIGGPADYLHFFDAIHGFDFAYVLHMSAGFYVDYGRILDRLQKAEHKIATYAHIGYLPHTITRVSLPAMLAGADSEVSLLPAGDSPSALESFKSDLAVLARTGMPRAQVLSAVTQHPAAWLGLDKDYGTLTKDKVADLVFFDGDPLDPLSMVTRTMIAGKIVHDKKEKRR